MALRFGTGLFGVFLCVSRLAAGSSVPAEPPPVLVELFTSEGCSSCPPADHLLQQLNGMHTRAGARIIAISEHVTYWDQLGWKDPFSSEAATERQSAYSDHFHLDSVYTPQMIVNGRDQMVGSSGAQVVQALENQPAVESSLHIESVRKLANGTEATIELHHVEPGADIYAVIAQDTASTAVPRGENSGHTLTHVSVARSLLHVGHAGAETNVTLRLPAAALASTDQQKRHLVVFAQTRGTGAILAADSTPL